MRRQTEAPVPVLAHPPSPNVASMPSTRMRTSGRALLWDTSPESKDTQSRYINSVKWQEGQSFWVGCRRGQTPLWYDIVKRNKSPRRQCIRSYASG